MDPKIWKLFDSQIPLQIEKYVNVVLSNQIEPKDYLFAYATAFQHALEPQICFDTKDFEEKLKESGWQASHLQMSTLGWKRNFV